MDMNFVEKKKINQNYARMYTDAYNALSNSKFQIITVAFAYLFSVWIVCKCMHLQAFKFKDIPSWNDCCVE